MLKSALAASALVLAACHLTACDRGGDDDGDSAGPKADWGFANTADKDGFKAKLSELDKLAVSASRGNVAKVSHGGTTKQLGPAWSILESYAQEDGDVSAPTPEPAAGCERLIDIFGFGATPTGGSGLALADGGSCSDAVRSLKSYYSQSLSALQQQVSWLKTLQGGTELCGMRIEETAVDAASAAIGFQLTPSDMPSGAQYDHRLFGAANDTQVGYLTSLVASCDSTKGDCDDAPNFSVVGLAEAIGMLKEKKLSLKSEFAVTMEVQDPKDGGSFDVTTAVKSESMVSGLGDTELLKASESTSFELAGDPSAAPGEGPEKVNLTLNLDEVGEGRLRVSGSYTTNDTAAAPQTFKFEFRRTDSHCAIDTTIEDAEPETPGVALEQEDLAGTWISQCAQSSIGRWGYVKATERSQFQGNKFTRYLTTYTDADCFQGKESAEIRMLGTYEFTGELPDSSRYDEISEYGLDIKYSKLEVMLKDQNIVDLFNRDAVCNKTDWAVGATKQFEPGTCYFDVGYEALLNSETMRRKVEYVSVRPYSNGLTLDMAQSTFSTGETAATRARTQTGGERMLKKL